MEGRDQNPCLVDVENGGSRTDLGSMGNVLHRVASTQGPHKGMLLHVSHWTQIPIRETK